MCAYGCPSSDTMTELLITTGECRSQYAAAVGRSSRLSEQDLRFTVGIFSHH